MTIFIETKSELTPYKPYRFSRSAVKPDLRNKADMLPSGFTREELRQIVAEQID